MGEKERKMSLSELMNRLGDAQPGSIARPPLEAEFERRKLIWTRMGVAVAAVGVLVAAVAAFVHLK
jgi:hypothetical protein